MDPNVNNGRVNVGFDPRPEAGLGELGDKKDSLDNMEPLSETKAYERPKWDNGREFLMSCIATSVGLGNVWRFPIVAYRNGGGAFLIPYLVVLFLIGKPMYYLETVLGQFSNSNCAKIWGMVPALRGTGYAQAVGETYVLSYYVSIIGTCLYYFSMSFSAELPWSVCQPEWGELCVPSGQRANESLQGIAKSSAELYFTQTILRQTDGIHDGLGGWPLWDLTLCLFASWILIYMCVFKGVKSSGKAAYFLALFPYVILITLFVRAVTLPGADKGILFFLTPQWSSLTNLTVWYEAVVQAFFSLSVCSGSIIIYASYNQFTRNVYRDALIVSTLDTFTSLLSGLTIFGILGNLAYQLGYDGVDSLDINAGSSLAFISYPDAIAQSPFAPQLFAVIFFLMMAVLGVGSAVALLTTVNAILMDSFPRVPVFLMSAITCCVGFCLGLVYVTPSGQYILELVDFYGGTFMRLFTAIGETIGVFWIYGLENLCIDIEFMLGRKTSWYWRICWSITTPAIMCTVFFYSMISAEQLVYGDYVYPDAAYIAGSMLQYVGMSIVPIFIVVTLVKYRSASCLETVKRSFRMKESYGPSDKATREQWRHFRRDAKDDRRQIKKNWFHHIGMSLIGGYRRGK